MGASILPHMRLVARPRLLGHLGGALRRWAVQVAAATRFVVAATGLGRGRAIFLRSVAPVTPRAACGR